MDIEASSPERAEEIRKAVKSRYQEVAISPAGRFAYPVGVESALEFGYARFWLELVPAAAVNRFVGVGNPFSIRMPNPGDRVLDAGCGCGLDAFIAASMIGFMGRAVGIGITAGMLKVARSDRGFYNPILIASPVVRPLFLSTIGLPL